MVILKVPDSFKSAQMKRLTLMTASIFLLLILGAWVSSSPDGNQGCSVGFLMVGQSVGRHLQV